MQRWRRVATAKQSGGKRESEVKATSVCRCRTENFPIVIFTKLKLFVLEQKQRDYNISQLYKMAAPEELESNSKRF